jgi:cytochrome c oxidase subunit II
MMVISRLERIWLTIGVGILAAFLAALIIDAVVVGASPPSSMRTIDPNTVLVSGEFAQPGVYRTGLHSYMVHIAAFTFGFSPNLIKVPAGAKVTFMIASRDVVHGFEIVDTDINVMVVPGYVSSVTHTFSHKGHYLILCNEYCGSGHQSMFANLEVV